jgi:hypothetical protein
MHKDAGRDGVVAETLVCGSEATLALDVKVILIPPCIFH